MHPIFLELTAGLSLCGDPARDVPLFLVQHGCTRAAVHCARVSALAFRLARRFGLDAQSAAAAGWLHDVSAVFPNAARIATAHSLDLEVLPAEEAHPKLVHQKLSAAMAEQIFGITDAAVLSAIGCHTTLKADSGGLDQVVFAADKIGWDEPGRPPYDVEIRAALDVSLVEACRVYLDYIHRTLPALHPWAQEAWKELSGITGAADAATTEK